MLLGGVIIPDDAIDVDFVRAGGPGGQNVNKVSTAVLLRVRLGQANLPQPLLVRLRRIAGSRVTAAGELIIQASRHRTQLQNRTDALERLAELLAQAAVVPKRRIKTRPSAGSKARRLDSKRIRSRIKQSRRDQMDL